MSYPVWDAPIGYGVLMGVIAILHVFVSHFAIGGGLYLVLAERRARRNSDDAALDFLKRMSRFFVLLTLVFGALSGVGIWFIIGLLSPAATEVLIHQFGWVWAIEWTFFVVEITAAILYYHSWDRITAKAHLTLGWIYFVAAWLSLFAINGIITFMLTPGRWLETGSVLHGFFNPTFWPSLVLRTGICGMLAGLYGLLLAAREPEGDFKARTVRATARWGLLGLAASALSLAWYAKAVPAAVTAKATLDLSLPGASLQAALWLAAVLAALLLLALLWGKRLPAAFATVLMLVGLVWFGAFETWRESLRKPYIIHGYLYGNGLRVTEATATRQTGLLTRADATTGDLGLDLFLRTCRSCHTWSGYKPLKPAFDGTEPGFVATVVQNIHLLRGNMPPFPGNAAEAELLATHLHARTDQRPLSARFAGAVLGRQAFAIRCAICHPVNSPNDKSKSFTGLSAGEIGGLLDMAADLGEGMPPYTGDEKERTALIEHLQTLGRKVKP
ncbi:MAG: cytochrome ubiquinol oxidase subunit I [Holophaga sp.]|nr:cytochrome ubiquinol oxidase subunit I [Holophaga sp.]